MNEAKRNRIVEKHANAMLAELRASGFDPLGIAGGIVHAPDGRGTNPCHVFYVVNSDVRRVDASTPGEEFAKTFMRDVAAQMVL